MKKASSLLIALILAAGWARAASAEPAACRAVPEAETHLAVLLSPDDVLRVEAVNARRAVDSTMPALPPAQAGEGVRIVLASRPFVTVDWLQGAIDCHRAALAAAGKTGASRLPMDLDGAQVHVGGAPGILTVDITSRDARVAQEILARALALVPDTRPPP